MFAKKIKVTIKYVFDAKDYNSLTNITTFYQKKNSSPADRVTSDRVAPARVTSAWITPARFTSS